MIVEINSNIIHPQFARILQIEEWKPNSPTNLFLSDFTHSSKTNQFHAPFVYKHICAPQIINRISTTNAIVWFTRQRLTASKVKLKSDCLSGRRFSILYITLSLSLSQFQRHFVFVNVYAFVHPVSSGNWMFIKTKWNLYIDQRPRWVSGFPVEVLRLVNVIVIRRLNEKYQSEDKRVATLVFILIVAQWARHWSTLYTVLSLCE